MLQHGTINNFWGQKVCAVQGLTLLQLTDNHCIGNKDPPQALLFTKKLTNIRPKHEH